MAYADPVLRAYSKRVNKRTREHGNWRQLFIEAAGMCQYPDEHYGVCASIDGLEYHHSYGEFPEWNGNGQVILCNLCHTKIHGDRQKFNRQRPSMLIEDVEFEIARDGGLDQWMKRYNLNGDKEVRRW